MHIPPCITVLSREDDLAGIGDLKLFIWLQLCLSLKLAHCECKLAICLQNEIRDMDRLSVSFLSQGLLPLCNPQVMALFICGHRHFVMIYGDMKMLTCLKYWINGLKCCVIISGHEAVQIRA